MDGNGRWAKKRHLPRIAGHRAGKETARTIIEACAKKEIEALTLFAFGEENWNRPEAEVSQLMELLLLATQQEVKALHENNIRLRFIGDRSRFSPKLLESMRASESLTENNTGMQLIVAVSYSGRWDICHAAKMIARDVQNEKLIPDEITQERFADYLSLASLPEPDLFIRTSGEKRISNFMLWELAYTELFFTEIFWPDFKEEELDAALTFYATRQRRFGQTAEQLLRVRHQNA